MNLPNTTVLVHATPPTVKVVAIGEFDVATAAALTAQLNGAVAAGCRDFCIDLGRVTFLEATTVGVFVGLDRHLGELGGSLTIVAAAPCVRRILTLVGLTRMLDGTAPARSSQVSGHPPRDVQEITLQMA